MSFARSISFNRPALVAAVALLLVSGCAGEQASPAPADQAVTTTASTNEPPAAVPVAPAASRDVCAMISADELKTATGIEGNAAPSKSGGADVCTWTSARGKSAIVQVYPTSSAYENSRSAFEGLYNAKSEDLTGIGDKAFFIAGKTGPFDTATISATKGTGVVSVQVMGMGDSAAFRNEATELTKVVLGKL